MTAISEAAVNRLHLAVAAVALWLVGTSPWVAMLRRVPASADWVDRAHVVVGFAALLLGLAYAIACSVGGGWRRCIPWLVGGGAAIGRDLGGLLRGQIPSAEGAGLYSTIEGLLLAAFVVAGLAGAGWYLAQGGDAALAWRSVHVIAARLLIALLVLHATAVASHLLDFVR